MIFLFYKKTATITKKKYFIPVGHLKDYEKNPNQYLQN